MNAAELQRKLAELQSRVGLSAMLEMTVRVTIDGLHHGVTDAWVDYLGQLQIAVRGHCRHCGRADEDNPGDYYHDKACEAQYIREAIEATTDEIELQKLRARLEMAEFVGD